MQNIFQKKMRRLLIGLLIFFGTILFCYCENNVLTVSEYDIVSEKIPESFDGFVIVQISDLHNKMFGKDQSRLVKRIKEQKPDLIVITGDLIDSNHPNVETGLLLAREAMKIAPVYFVTGNHDNYLSDTDTYALFQGLEQLGVRILKDERVELYFETSEEYIALLGIDDDTVSYTSRLHETLEALTKQENQDDAFTLLLAHQPQRLPEYAEYDIDLVLSGHAHGGQFRIPFIGGFVAPDQGFLPEYTQGAYEENGTHMILSAGLGNSVIPLRLLNHPEVVKITLKYN